MKGRFLITLVLLLVLQVACTGQDRPSGSPVARTLTATDSMGARPATPVAFSTPTSPAAQTPSPTTTAPLTPTTGLGISDLKYLLISRFGEPFYCDPDLYPVAHAIGQEEVDLRVSEIQKERQVFIAILRHLALPENGILSASQKRLVYSEYKKLNAISLEPLDDRFQFGLRIPAGQRTGTAIDGSIDATGIISIVSQQPTINTCPICLATGSLIETPDGDIPVQEMRKGMPVWTADVSGVKQRGVVLETVRRELPESVTMVRLTLEDGRQVLISPGHPLTDGRFVDDLAPGHLLDGSRLLSVEEIPYEGGATYDILPSGETGDYWANGIPFKSTLAQ